jgi:hypothetical protein
MKIFGHLPPGVADSIGMLLTIKFTSDLCQNAFIISYPIESLTYDISSGAPYQFNKLEWEKSDPDCPDI